MRVRVRDCDSRNRQSIFTHKSCVIKIPINKIYVVVIVKVNYFFL
jgi:hypothetical protein